VWDSLSCFAFGSTPTLEIVNFLEKRTPGAVIHIPFQYTKLTNECEWCLRLRGDTLTFPVTDLVPNS